MASVESKALKSFLATHARAVNLATLSGELRGREEGPHACADDVMRSAVVTAVAAMDAFFTRRFAELLVPFLKKNGANARLTTLLQAAGLDTHVALELAVMDRPYRRIRSLVQQHLSTYTTQRFHAIDELFLGLGVKDLSKHAQGLIKRKRLLRSVELLVERRHLIVHEGDIAQNGGLNVIDAAELSRRLADVRTYVTHADSLINKAVKV